MFKNKMKKAMKVLAFFFMYSLFIYDGVGKENEALFGVLSELTSVDKLEATQQDALALFINNVTDFHPLSDISSESSTSAWDALTKLSDKVRLQKQFTAEDNAVLMQIYKDYIEEGYSEDDSGLQYLSGLYDYFILEKRHLQRALKRFKVASDLGEGRASFLLGEIYNNGVGSEIMPDKDKAIAYYKTGLDQGSIDSGIYLYNSYYYGKNGVKKDEKRARAYWQQIKDEDTPAIVYELGKHYFDGTLGYEKDERQGLTLFQRAADEGYGKAKATLVILHHIQNSVLDEEKALALAYRYKEDTLSIEDMSLIYGVLVEGVEILEKDDQKAYELAQEGWRRSDESSSIIAGLIGRMYYHGVYVDKDIQEAINWFELSWQLNDKETRLVFEDLPLCMLGEIHFKGFGVKQDFNKAKLWYERCNLEGTYLASNNLGQLYKAAYGDEKMAEQHFMQAIEYTNHVSSMHDLGLLYHERNTEESYEKAYKWFNDAAQLGLPLSMMGLSEMHRLGNYVEQDDVQCYVWAKLANERGVKKAYMNIERCGNHLTDAAKKEAEKASQRLAKSIPIRQ